MTLDLWTRKISKLKWKSFADDQEFSHVVNSVHSSFNSIQALQDRLAANNVFSVASRKNPDGDDVVYFSSQTATGEIILTELRLVKDLSKVYVACKTLQHIAPLFIQSISFLISTNS